MRRGPARVADEAEINRRDEACRLEPLHLGENLDVFSRLETIRWGDYPYSVILLPG